MAAANFFCKLFHYSNRGGGKRKKKKRVWWDFAVANSHVEVWGIIFDYLFKIRVNLRTPTFGFQVLIFMTCSCLTWNSFNCLRWLQSWDRGLACSFTHLSKQRWERKWAISFYDFWWNYFSLSILWSNFNGVSWALKFSGLGFGHRK